jgi:hypothetical protein
MRGHVLVETGSVPRLDHRLADRGPRDVLAPASARKQFASERPAPPPVGPQLLEQLRAQRYLTALASLAVADAQHAALGVDVVDR